MLKRIYIIFYFSLIFICNNPIAQTIVEKNSFKINLSAPQTEHTLHDSLGYKFIDYYDYTDPSKEGEFKLPKKHLIIAIPPNSSPKLSYKVLKSTKLERTVPVTNPRVVKLDDSTLVYNKTDYREAVRSMSTDPIIQMGRKFWYRDFYCVEIIFKSHEFDPSSNVLVISQSVEVTLTFENQYSFLTTSPIKVLSRFDSVLLNSITNSDIAEQFRSSPPKKNYMVRNNWINYDQEYVKISVFRDGIYRISKDDLDVLGITTSILNPKTLQLFESGIEQKIYVFGEDDFNFDEEDYIEFYGIKNYSKTDHRLINSEAEPYSTFLNRYTDTTFYFLTWGNEDGLRINLDNTPNSGSLEILDYHTAYRHYENNSWYQNCNGNEVANQTSDWNKNKNWYWGWLTASTNDGNVNFNLNIEHLYPNKNGKAYFKLTSWGSNINNNAHKLTLFFNDTKLDSQNVNRYSQVLLTGEITSSLLKEGANKISVRNYANGTLPNVLAYDWFEIEFPRYNTLSNDTLLIKIPDGYLNKIVEFNISNAESENYLIYKIKNDLKKFENYSVNSGVLTFVDTVSSSEEYVLFSEDKVSKPKSKYLGKFTNLIDDDSQADYLSITSVQFGESVHDYINQINSLYDISVKQVFVEDIFYEFGYGYPTPESIREFVQHAYNTWTIPKISYLTLIGDATHDYKDYTQQNSGIKLSNNIVPAYGYPVSDNWFAIWDENAPYIPQLVVGRIPINRSEELSYYQSKLLHNEESGYSNWNKRYIFFSGGTESKPSELLQLRAANNSVISEVIDPRPIGGMSYHFYKTINPHSDFGPYSLSEMQNSVDEGGLIISYLGHSGTSTWDNSINSIAQLRNRIGKNPVISDFGCSTNKYAEPDIVCFGEKALFDEDGQAINYIGNSSLGFLSTAVSAPKYFYEGLIKVSRNVGDAHLYLKSKLYESFGNSSVFKVFSLSNVILGDPTAIVKVPPKPNLMIDPNSLIIPNTITDAIDSIKIKLVIYNWGSADEQKYILSITQRHNSEIVFNKNMERILPAYIDTVETYLMTKGLAGENSITIILDIHNEIDEFDESDNMSVFTFNIYPSDLFPLLNYSIENGNISLLKLMNPLILEEENPQLKIQITDNIDFANVIEINSFLDTLVTPINLSENRFPGRNWVRYKLNNQSGSYSIPVSYNTFRNYNFLLNDIFSFENQVLKGIRYESNQLSIAMDTINVEVYSAGANAGANLAIKLNGKNLMSNTFFAGIGLVVLDSTTLRVDTAEIFELYDKPEKVQELANLLYSLPSGKLVLMAVANDARTRMDSNLRNAIKTIGSSKIDSLLFQCPWAIIGRKGANPDDPDIWEDIRFLPSENITLTRDYYVPSDFGYLTTTKLGPVSNWDTLFVDYQIPNGAELSVTPFGIKQNEEVDTLSTFILNSSTIPINFISPKSYPYAKFRFKFTQNEDGESPSISQIGVSHHNTPELAINYQTASIDRDTVMQGESIAVNYKASNVGEGRALNVRTKVDLFFNNNILENVFDSTLLYINSETSIDIGFEKLITTEYEPGSYKFVIDLDTDNSTLELYEDNNSFELPFLVTRDTVTSISSAVVSANFDGYEIYDGDYVSSSPEIDIILDYEGQFEVSDTNSFQISLNGRKINFSSLNTVYETQNSRIIFKYNPTFEDGDYSLSVVGENIRPANSSDNEFIRFFKISSENKILYPYNFPNPFVNETHFTFKLTQVPNEIRIKIYTIAGRLIREIKVDKSQLNFDFNRIFWDGRDEDGDLLANGVYLYKIISTDDDETVSVTSKLAIVR